MQKIYLTGPEVFELDADEIRNGYVKLCKEHGFICQHSLEIKISATHNKRKTAKDIFAANKNMIDKADIIIANLNCFRGKEANSGTVWECGYAFALGKQVYGYIDNTNDYIDRFKHYERSVVAGKYIDKKKIIIEDFNLPLNLMIACSISVENIVAGGLTDVLKNIKAI